MSQSALDTFSVTRTAPDPRADDANRTVRISRETVLIQRIVEGVRMRLTIPVSGYRGLSLMASLTDGKATLRLRHDDPELDVVLAHGDGVEVARRAKAWSQALGQSVRIEEASVRIDGPYPRRRARVASKRSSRFARRRKLGRPERLETSFAGEHEIIARG